MAGAKGAYRMGIVVGPKVARNFAAMEPALPLIPACYFGSVEHYRLLATNEQVMVDIGEHYVRQSHRTRTRIAGPNGPQELSVQVVHGPAPKVPMREVRLSVSETWPQQHLHAIRSAYGKSPWAVHFMDDIEEVLLAGHERLVDLDLATMRLGLKWLGLRTELVVSETYVEVMSSAWRGASITKVSRHSPLATHCLDLRSTLHPKKPLPPEVQPVGPYPQVFAFRHGFLPRLSIIDLVMNTGPKALDVLRS